MSLPTLLLKSGRVAKRTHNLGLALIVALAAVSACSKKPSQEEDAFERGTPLADNDSACGQLVKRLCDELGPSDYACELAKEKLLKAGDEQCTKLVERYDALRDDMRKRQLARSTLSVELQQKLVAGNPPSSGSPDSKVKLVVFSDFECPTCKRVAPTVEQIVEKYGDRIHVVYRSYPLKKHLFATTAAEAALAANAQGKFEEFQKALFRAEDPPNKDTLRRAAKEIGVDAEAIIRAIDDGTYVDEVAADVALGDECGVLGTPALLLNGVQVRQFEDIDAIAELIDSELAK